MVSSDRIISGHSRSGQMLIVIVLTMIVALTIGLSIAARTVTNLKISRQNDESERAFQAAEAGISQVLQSGSSQNYPNFTNNATYSTKVVHPGNTSFPLNNGELVDQDTGIDVWLANYPDFNSGSMTGTFTVYWGTDNQTDCGQNKGPATKSALELAVLSGNKLNPSISKYLFEANTCSGRVSYTGTLPATGAGATPNGTTVHFQNSATITVTNGLIMKVIPIFNSSKIFLGSNSGSTFPTQGTVVESTGTSGDTTRKVQYFSSYPQVPIEMFPYSFISQ